MTKILNKIKNRNVWFLGLGIIILAQAIIIIKLWTGKDDKTYEVNLVKINTQKDSVDFAKMKNDLTLVDNTVRDLNSFLESKNISNSKIEILESDSLSSAVYLAKQSNRYSQYLMDLQKKLMEVPLGMPTSGYISSNFGKRKNPIPYRKVLASAKPNNGATTIISEASINAAPKKRKVIDAKIVEEKDSLGNVKKVVIPIYAPETSSTVAVMSNPAGLSKTVTQQPTKEINNPPSEADQMQFHKGLDIAVPFGSDVMCTAAGTVIFAGQKGGYGNCIIVSHGNGLATLYGHLSQILVKTNDKIKVNQIIAKSGNSGRSTGPHLHYEVHKNNTPVNPKFFMNF